MGETTSIRQAFIAVLRNRNFHKSFLVFLFAYYTLIYYFGELIDFAGWEALRWDFFYGVHDVHRIFFLAPIVYAGHVFRVKGAVIATLAAFIIFLPRAFIISPFPDPLLRTVLFTAVVGIAGVLTGIARNESERRSHLEAMVRSERDRLLGILERMEEGVIIVGPDYGIRFMNSSMIQEFGECTSSSCYQYLHKSNTPCEAICKLPAVIDGRTERWEYTFPDSITYEVVASPYVDSDGAVCQLATFRNITQRKKA